MPRLGTDFPFLGSRSYTLILACYFPYLSSMSSTRVASGISQGTSSTGPALTSPAPGPSIIPAPSASANSPPSTSGGNPHRIVLIAAPIASIAAVVIILGIAYFLWRRRPSHRSRIHLSPHCDEVAWKYSGGTPARSNFTDSTPASPVYHAFPVAVVERPTSAGSSFACGGVPVKTPYYNYFVPHASSGYDGEPGPAPRMAMEQQRPIPPPTLIDSSSSTQVGLPAQSLERADSAASTVPSLYSRESMRPPSPPPLPPPPPAAALVPVKYGVATATEITHSVIHVPDMCDWVYTPRTGMSLGMGAGSLVPST
ncbi:hypothetical protein FB45DRAFT_1062660 [Roridomyces roridus]|uniref:Uncharacterized protein n=1 Tax=Roridomyces roridus TaxID=1738132 RepID=A0AAD7FHK7_9AGAR|nr:hypothetical protein FB45DRAFT_1062660 [Roridomyces roridus]